MTIRKYVGAAALLFTIAGTALGQQPPHPPMAPGAPKHPQARMAVGHGMVSVETALRMKDKLKLTTEQAAQLETLRKEIVAERKAQAAEHIDLQSRVAAGLIEPDEVRKQFDGRRDELTQTFKQRQERIEKILTEEQRDQLGHAAHHMMGERMRAMRQQRGFAPRRGFDYGRGMRSQSAPRMRRFEGFR
jgi:Spy/CpxP family protein refolding chaperone